MPRVEISEKNFATTVQDGIVVLGWSAAWCGPCQAFAPIFERAAERHPEIKFARVDTEAQAALARQLDIRSIPPVMIYRDGILLFAQPGALPAARLEELINKVRSLDMDQVRRKVAEETPVDVEQH